LPRIMDTVSFVDQIDSGGPNQRGCNADQGLAGVGNSDWCYEILTNGTAGLSGANVNYGNIFAGSYSQPSETESPVIDVTSVSNTNPDRAWAIPAIPANTRPGATSPNFAVLVGDDGGYNALGFGEWDDANYEVKVDVYLPNHTATLNNSLNQFVRLGLAVRVQQHVTDPTSEEVAIEGAGNITRPYGCYCLLYDSSEGNVYPTKILAQDPVATWDDIRDRSLTNVSGTTVPVVEFLGSPISVTEGWHTWGIKASGEELTFTVDDTVVIVNDATYSAGKAGLLYRTYTATVNTATYDHGGKFDNLRVQPAPTPTPTPTPFILSVNSSWGLYE